MNEGQPIIPTLKPKIKLDVKYPVTKPKAPYQVSFYKQAYQGTLKSHEDRSLQELYAEHERVRQQRKVEVYTTSMQGKTAALNDLIEIKEMERGCG